MTLIIAATGGVGPPFRRSATPKDRDETWIAGWSSLTLTPVSYTHLTLPTILRV